MESAAGSRADEIARASLILADTSAWIEYLRRRRSPSGIAVRELGLSRRIATTEPVLMEVLAGASTDDAVHRLTGMLGRCEMLPIVGRADFMSAAAIYRACRGAGRTMRNQLDCLVAAIAVRTGTPLLHQDADFDVIAEHTGLQVYEPG